MTGVHWPSVIAVGIMNVFFVTVLIVTKFYVVRHAVRREMDKAVVAISKRLDASEIFLTAAEQHTALQHDWDKRRQEEHDRRNRENLKMIQRLIDVTLDKRLATATDKVVKKVEQVPQETANLVATESAKATEAVKAAVERLGTGDSHHG